MLKRTLTAVVLIAVVVALLFVGGWAPSVTVLLLILGAMLEMYKALANININCIRYTGVLYCLFLAPMYHFCEMMGILMLTVTCLIIALTHSVFSKKHTVSDGIYSAFVLLYPGLAATPLYCATRFDNYQIVLAVLIGSVAFAVLTDMGAYFTGTLFGKHKLIPSISPKKTVEGAIGGIVFSVLGGVGMYFAAPILFPDTLPICFLIISVGAGFLAQIGDLIASAIKRMCDIKDYGNIFPGHGGVLDRLDSIIFTTIFAFGVFYLVGVF